MCVGEYDCFYSFVDMRGYRLAAEEASSKSESDDSGIPLNYFQPPTAKLHVSAGLVRVCC